MPNANYLWINLFATSLKPKGRAALVMANSASDARHSEADIRKALIEANLIYGMLTMPSNMFYSVTLPATLWFFDKGKKDERILFIDARNIFTQIDRAHREFSDEQVSELLDESVVVNNAEGFKAKEFEAHYEIIKRGRTWDLSKIDFEKLRHDFGQAVYKNIEIADLRGFIARKLELMLAQNSTRGQFAQRFQQIVENYNAGGSSTEQYFEQLVQFSQDMRAEDQRHVREGLSEDELEIFDLLKKETMTQVETQKVKLAAKALLSRLQDESPKVLVQGWYKTDQTRRIVRSAVAEVLDRELPVESYDRVLFQTKCDNVFYLVLDRAAQGKRWAI